MDESESFGAWIGRRRRALHLTQEAVAEQLYCALGTVRKIESDERHPSRELAARLAQVLQLPEEQQTTFLKVARGELALDRLSLTVGADKPRPPPGSPPPRTNLPRQSTSFVGRDALLAEVRALLLREDVGLATLTGPGGTGKTRLASQTVAGLRDDFADGVCFVNLAPISDPALVASTIAHALGLTATSARAPLDDLKDYLRDKQILLLLDNFEQVADAAVVVAELLAAAPALTVLVTSRVPLHLQGEHERLVPPLTLPTNGDQPLIEHLSTYEAVRLFTERSQAVMPDFAVTSANAPAITEICNRLDGFPLAIELAAARTKFLAPQALLARLDSRLHLLTSGARDLPARQQTLRNTIDWSYSLLNATEQTLFRRLAVFVGGCDVEAVAAVCFGSSYPAPEAASAPWSHSAEARPADAFEGLISLVDKSLLRQHPEGTGDVNGEPRFSMFEMIREYARERLEESGEIELLRQAHAAYFLRFVETAELALAGHGQQVWAHRLAAEHDNIRSVLVWTCTTVATIEQGLRIAPALDWFWSRRGFHREARQWLERLLAQPGGSVGVRAKALLNLAGTVRVMGEYTLATQLFDESLACFRELDDRAGIARTLLEQGRSLRLQGDFVRATSLEEESLALFQTLQDRSGVASALMSLGDVALDQGDLDRAQIRFGETKAMSQAVGNIDEVAWANLNLGWAAHAGGDDVQATRLLEESLAQFRVVDDHGGIVAVLQNMGYVAYAQGDIKRAAALFRESVPLTADVVNPSMVADTFAGLARVAAVSGQAERAARLGGRVAALLTPGGHELSEIFRAGYDQDVALARTQLGETAFAAGEAEGWAMTLEQAIAYVLEPDALQVVTTRGPGCDRDEALQWVRMDVPTLTTRELAVLRLVAEGAGDREVAARLGLRPRTVTSYLTAIYRKLQVRTRTAAVHIAGEYGLL